MKTYGINRLGSGILILAMLVSFGLKAQIGGWKADLIEDSEKALTEMIEKQPKLQSFKDKSYGYAVFPRVTKGAFGVGGAGGKGIVYKDHVPTGQSTLSQVTIGFQAGGQQYKEVIFFENAQAYEKFTNKKVKFDGQASAVAITEGGSADVAFKDGMAVFTHTSGGLMFEASIGGQHFSFKPKK
jgi:lipid-binding SYLF domain-containing protein